MVAYSFKARFAVAILSGEKDQTIRADRKRHARPGEALQLYSGMRTKSCRLIARATCLDVQGIELNFLDRFVRFTSSAASPGFTSSIANPVNLDAFARRDGFRDWTDMEAFWKAEHDADVFAGVLIRWRLETA